MKTGKEFGEEENNIKLESRDRYCKLIALGAAWLVIVGIFSSRLYPLEFSYWRLSGCYSFSLVVGLWMASQKTGGPISTAIRGWLIFSSSLLVCVWLSRPLGLLPPDYARRITQPGTFLPLWFLGSSFQVPLIGLALWWVQKPSKNAQRGKEW
jgi:hypothetical protein